VEVWSGEQRLAVHPRAGRPGQRFTLPGQWSGLRLGDSRPKKEPLATQVEEIEVEQRPLELYQPLESVPGSPYPLSGVNLRNGKSRGLKILE